MIKIYKNEHVYVTFSHAQSIASVKAYSHWLSQYCNESLRNAQEKEKFKSLISTLLEAVVPLLSKQVSHLYLK